LGKKTLLMLIGALNYIVPPIKLQISKKTNNKT